MHPPIRQCSSDSAIWNAGSRPTRTQVHAAGKAAREEMARVSRADRGAHRRSPLPRSSFTSGATEANNLAIKGIAQASRHIGRHIISTPLEHSSVSGSLTALQERGWEIDLLSIGRDGTVDPEEVRELLRPDTVLVAHLRGGQRAWHHSAGKRNRSAAG